MANTFGINADCPNFLALNATGCVLMYVYVVLFSAQSNELYATEIFV